MNRGKAKRERKAHSRVERLGVAEARSQREVLAWINNRTVPSRSYRRSPRGRLEAQLMASKLPAGAEQDPRTILADMEAANGAQLAEGLAE